MGPLHPGQGARQWAAGPASGLSAARFGRAVSQRMKAYWAKRKAASAKSSKTN
jgi:hypothetical protein